LPHRLGRATTTAPGGLRQPRLRRSWIRSGTVAASSLASHSCAVELLMTLDELLPPRFYPDIVRCRAGNRLAPLPFRTVTAVAVNLSTVTRQHAIEIHPYL
jgi:hypothetical protein